MKPPKGGEILPVLALPLAGPRRPVGVLRDGAEGARNEVAELKADYERWAARCGVMDYATLKKGNTKARKGGE